MISAQVAACVPKVLITLADNYRPRKPCIVADPMNQGDQIQVVIREVDR